MSWKNLKIFAIVTLLIMDIVFALFVIERKYSVLYYDDALIDSAVTVFSESGLHVDRAFLEERKPSPAVYTGSVEPQAFSEITKAMVREGYQAQEDTDGMRFIGGQGEFFFGNDFVFTYAAENESLPSALMENGIWTALSEGEEKDSVLQTALSFLERYAFASEPLARYGYDIRCPYVYSLGGDYIVQLVQSIDGISLEEGLCLLISDGEVRSADGTLCALRPREKKSAENVGLMNVLFAEKAYIDTLQQTDASGYTVSAVTYSYGLYFDADNTFYLIPLCRITYLNGETRIYNFVSGKLYS